MRQKIADEEKMRKAREEYSQGMVDVLEFLAELKRAGLLEFHDGQPCLVDWVYQEADKREGPAPYLGPGDPSTWD